MDDDNGDVENPSPPSMEEKGGDSALNDASSKTPSSTKRNINSYYGHKIGFLQTLSLTLNAGLMIYAHLGLSAVILSSRDPNITSSLNTNNGGGNVVNNESTSTIDIGDELVENNTQVVDNTSSALVNETNNYMLDGKCNTQDLETWISTNGEVTRPKKSNYCSREYNGGCFLDSKCIERCFQEVHGYSEECSVCFGSIPSCSIGAGCMLPCANDSLGDECKQCNTPCIEELQVCTGLPENVDEYVAALLPEEEISQEISVEEDGKCNEQDTNIWTINGGELTRPQHSNFCSRIYNGGCFLDSTCIETCFQLMFGYSEECSSCFGEVPGCSVSNGCTMVCAANSLGEECKTCNQPCVEELGICTGLPRVDNNETSPANNETVTDKNDTATIVLPPNEAIEITNKCNDFDLEAIETWYDVYNLTFVKSIQDAWTGDAKLLAVIIVLFSGIWPYLKNIILVIIWYTPATVETQTSTLLWLSRLSKYTLVDVFAVIGVLVGVQLQLNVGGTEAVTRAEPRFGIIAFFLATVWEFFQIEVIKAMHERKVLPLPNETEQGEDRLFFSKLWVPVLILLASLALYISGAVTEVVAFISADTSGVCNRTYNLVSLGNALINDMMTTSNSTLGQTWILYLSYVALILLFPILTHTLQICFIVGWLKSKRLKRLLDWTLMIWFFACVDVLLIGIFAVEYKFPNLVMKIAGDTNAGFLDIDSNLGSGFYILIAYSVAAGFLQFSLRIRHNN